MITTKVAGDLQAQLSSTAADEPVGVIVRHKPDIMVAQAVPDARVGHSGGDIGLFHAVADYDGAGGFFANFVEALPVEPLTTFR